MTKRVFAPLLMALTLTAADKPKDPPKISTDLRAKFWRAQAEAISAQAVAQRTQAALMAATDEMAKACGEAFELRADPAGEPVCQVKPEPPKGEKK